MANESFFNTKSSCHQGRILTNNKINLKKTFTYISTIPTKLPETDPVTFSDNLNK